MGWITLKRKEGGFRRGSEWLTRPCLAVSKDYIRLNPAAVQKWGWRAGDWLKVMVNIDTPGLWLRICNGDPGPDAFLLREGYVRKDESKGGSLVFNCKEIAKLFPASAGNAYRVDAPADDTVAVCSLLHEHKART